MPEEPVPPADDHEHLIIFRVSRLGLTERCVSDCTVSVCATHTTGWRTYTHYIHVDGLWGRECLGGEVPQGVYYLQFEEMGLEEKHAMRAAS